MISQKSADELKKKFKEEYKTNLTSDEAKEVGQRLVDYFSLLIEIDNKAKIVKR